MTVKLRGQGVNSHWNVHQALELLQGLQRSGLLLIEELDKHIAQRDAGRGIHAEMKGNATAAVFITSCTVELALKTAYAQTHPTQKPPKGHDLAGLFDALDQTCQRQAQKYLETLPVLGEQKWIGEQPDMRSILETGRSNFTDWRYMVEQPSVGGGVPKGLINVVQALRKVCRDLVQPQQ